MSVTTTILLQVGALAQAYRAGKLKKGDHEKLMICYWGCVLHEIGQNMQRIERVVRDSKDDTLGSCELIVTPYCDELLGELARMSPSGKQLAMVGELFQAIKQFSWWQDLANSSRSQLHEHGKPMDQEIKPWQTAIAAGEVAIAPDARQRFNGVLELVTDGGRQAFG